MMFSPTVRFTQERRGTFPETSNGGGSKNRYVRWHFVPGGCAQCALQTMGFQDIGGDRRFVRHIKFTTEKGEIVEARLVYDYCEVGLDVTKA